MYREIKHASTFVLKVVSRHAVSYSVYSNKQTNKKSPPTFPSKTGKQRFISIKMKGYFNIKIKQEANITKKL